MSRWKVLRLALIFFVAVSSLFAPLKSQSQIGWSALGIIFLFIPIGLLFVIGLQAANPRTAKTWRKPDWGLNPFNLKDPVQFFHLAAYAMFAQGAVTLCRILFARTSVYPEAMLPFVMGLGTLLGLRIVTLVFRKKFIEHR